MGGKHIRRQRQSFLIMILGLAKTAHFLKLSGHLIMSHHRLRERAKNVFIKHERWCDVSPGFDYEEQSCGNREQEPQRGMTSPSWNQRYSAGVSDVDFNA